ncbi:MAG: hypothetical protein AAF171_15575 [Cyanobacteria bacterium P01_A01_bin.116]
MNSENSPNFNSRGSIAETYEELQSLHVLRNITEGRKKSLATASFKSFSRSILQAAEVALLNSASLIAHASGFIQAGDFDSALLHMFWLRGFHRVLISLGQIATPFSRRDSRHNVSNLYIKESPAFQNYLNQLKHFDISFREYIPLEHETLRTKVANSSLDDPIVQLVQLVRVCNHESAIWEKQLNLLCVPFSIKCYEDFVGINEINEMVFGLTLEGNTFFTQFRALHQIPEILSLEMNAHIEKSIISMQVGDLLAAHNYISRGNQLIPSIISCLYPIADYLTTSDYHNIRENLGVTSGSHSKNIRQDLFNDLYTKIGHELARIKSSLVEESEEKRSSEYIYIHNLLEKEVFKLRNFIFHWRDLHMHFPRNVIGGNNTKSLKGSNDAVHTTRQMKEIALKKDPLKETTQQSYLSPSQSLYEEEKPISRYLSSGLSLDCMISDLTGNVTKERFRDVQNRTGLYAKTKKETVDCEEKEQREDSKSKGKCPFS